MKVNYNEVRDCARKLREAGDEVRDYLARAKGDLQRGGEGNRGFSSVAAYRNVVARLLEQSNELGENTGKSAASLAASADDHERTEETVRSELNIARDALGHIPAAKAS